MKNQKISIAGDLGGDTNVLLYIRNAVSYPVDDEHVVPFYATLSEYTSLVQDMVEIMD